eukprot:ctg_1284.g407
MCIALASPRARRAPESAPASMLYVRGVVQAPAAPRGASTGHSRLSRDGGARPAGDGAGGGRGVEHAGALAQRVGSAPPYATTTPPRVCLSLSSWHPQRETSASSGWTHADVLAPETTAAATTDVSPPRDTPATDFNSWPGGAEPYSDWREFCNVLLQEPGAAHPNHVSGARHPEHAAASDLPVVPADISADISDAQAQRWPSMDALYPAADAYRNENHWRASPPLASNTLPLFRDLLPAAPEPTPPATEHPLHAYVEDAYPAARTGYPWRD